MCAGLAALLGTVLLTGCPAEEDERAPEEEIDISALVTEWTEAGHSRIITFAAEESPCAGCHDGGAFAQGVNDPAELDREWPVAIDCRACHTGRGAERLESGETTIPSSPDTLALGHGALCAGCHRALRAPDIADEERRTPHYSPVTDVMQGVGGIRTDDMDVGSTEDHAEIDDACVGCHMLQAEEGHPSHTFRVIDFQEACGECHEEIESAEDTPTIQAAGDYDGDGSVEEFTAEVEGLLTLLNDTLTERMDGASYRSVQGRIVFVRGETTVTAPIPDEVYLAAYNHMMIDRGGAMGFHNPRFTIDLLQESYRALTGEAVPNAAPFGEEEAEETTPAPEGQETTPGGTQETTP
ncbi:MAG: hypothetical protein IBX62_09455 [Coriobacteriia bacterium]|nr:hypothetical protein [Coriobacteriia bacterium]